MAEELLDDPNVSPMGEHVGSAGVSEHVWADFPFNPRRLRSSLHDEVSALSAQPSTPLVQKKCSQVTPRTEGGQECCSTTRFQPRPERRLCGPSDRDQAFFVSLPNDAQQAFVIGQILKIEVDCLGNTCSRRICLLYTSDAADE